MSKKTTEVVWKWEKAGAEVPPAKPSRTRYWLQIAALAAVGALINFWLRHPVGAYVVWGLAALLLSGILFSDRVLHGFERVAAFLAHVIGTGLTWLLLTPLFYLVFWPGRLVQKLAGKDPMRRQLDPAAPSYWSDYQKLDIQDRYQRQY